MTAFFCTGEALALIIGYTPPDGTVVTVTNNPAGTPDVIEARWGQDMGVPQALLVYRTETDAEPFAVVYRRESYPFVYVPQLGAAEGTVYLRYLHIFPAYEVLTEATAVSYAAETAQKTEAPLPENIVVENVAAGLPDIIGLSEIALGDTVRVYKSATAAEPLAMTIYQTEQSFPGACVYQLGVSSGKVYVSVQSEGKLESDRVAVSYGKETVTPAIAAGSVTVSNLPAGLDDELSLSESLAEGTALYVYSASKGGEPIYSVTSYGVDPLSVVLPQGALAPVGGKLYISVKLPYCVESARTAVPYPAEPTTPTPAAANVSVINGVGDADSVTVTGLGLDSVVEVYKDAKGATLIGAGTAAAGTATVALDADLGLKAGKVYISVTSDGLLPSPLFAVSYEKETVTATPSAKSISVLNYANTEDVFTLSGAQTGDTVTGYAAKTGTDVLFTYVKESGSDSFTLSSDVLSDDGGKIYVSVRTLGAGESARTAVTYPAAKAQTLKAASVTVTNNYYSETDGAQDPGTEDAVTITGLSVGDTVSIYKQSTGAAKWADAISIESQEDLTDGALTVEIGQLGVAKGKIYVAVTKANLNESPRTAVAYAAEPVTASLAASCVLINNTCYEQDFVTLWDVPEDSTVTFYLTKTGGEAVTPVYTPEWAETLVFTLGNDDLTHAGGKLYVTLKEPGKHESARTAVSYESEETPAPKKGDMMVLNRPGEDYLVAGGLYNSGSVVRVYDAQTGGTLLAQSDNQTVKSLILTIPAGKLADSGGKIYVSVTRAGKTESKRVAVAYPAT
ncbi:MAG TPA: hypothetical protein VN446_09405 [Candidatus Acidoferrum sp.]|nr:hypothetical protein [Candidatus Acidoferrum sp.]